MWAKLLAMDQFAYNPPVNAPFLSLVVPAYNEAARLPESLAQIANFLSAQSYQSEVLVVENGSQDNTFKVAADFAKQNPNFSLIKLESRGKGLAVRTGMLAAKGTYRMMLDADLSMPVGEIGRFLPPQLESVAITIASREAPGAVRYNEPLYRHLGGRAINLLIRLLALPRLQDTQCGFKCFRAEVAEDLFAVQKMEGWSFDVEILYMARLRGYSIEELPIPWYYNSQSHVSPLRDSFRMLVDILRIRRNAARGAYAPAS